MTRLSGGKYSHVIHQLQLKLLPECVTVTEVDVQQTTLKTFRLVTTQCSVCVRGDLTLEDECHLKGGSSVQ